MLRKNQLLLTAFVLLPLAGGCGSRFAGEWVQETALQPNGTITPLTDQRRLALQFIPPSTVRVGMYADAAGVVEAGTVSSSDYQTIQNRSVAQFGAYTARVVEGQLVAYIGGEEAGRFRRLTGQSVFPPMVKLPQIVRADAPATENPIEPPPPGDVVVAVTK